MFHRRFGALCLVISGIFFVLYPVIRPFSDEVTLDGAAAFASTKWFIAHMFAMIAFTFLPVGLLGFHNSLKDTSLKSLTYSAVVLSIFGIGLTLPFYGGEAYGLHAIGLETIAMQNESLMSLTNVVRSGPGLIMFLIGLLLLAAASILVAISIWRSGRYQKWFGIPFALGISLYIPQFFAGQPLRVTHGLLVTIGCVLLAVELWGKNVRSNINKGLEKPL